MAPYKSIFLALNHSKVRYLVAGGVAVNLLGINRATMDLDLIIHLQKENVLHFVKVMTELGYTPKVPVHPEEFADPQKRESWIQEKNMKVFSFISHMNPFELIDVFVNEPFPFEEMYGRKKEHEAFGIKIPTVSLDDLIAMKQNAGRPKDLFDLSYLEELSRKNHDEK